VRTIADFNGAAREGQPGQGGNQALTRVPPVGELVGGLGNCGRDLCPLAAMFAGARRRGWSAGLG
jgi:hypothetical protein